LPARKFKIIHELSKGKTVCATTSEDGKHTHGGCGQRQPVYRSSSLKISANFKSVKDEDGQLAEARSVDMTPELVIELFKKISVSKHVLSYI
jgi:DNA-directed RNA polymerase II subunit RPB1